MTARLKEGRMPVRPTSPEKKVLKEFVVVFLVT